MRSFAKNMSSEEKWDIIFIPAIMVFLCLGLSGASYLIADKSGNLDVAYALWAVVLFFFIYGATLWWNSLTAWRNGKSSRSGLEEKHGPKEK